MSLALAEQLAASHAEALGHALTEFKPEQTRPLIGDVWRRATCVDCAMTWSVRWSPESGQFWCIARKIEPPKREDQNKSARRREPTPLIIGYLPHECDLSTPYGIWSFALDVQDPSLRATPA